MTLQHSKARGLKAANKIIFNDDGFATGKVIAVGYGEWSAKKIDKSTFSEPSPRLEIALSIAASQTPIKFDVFTSILLSDDYKVIGKGKTKRQYNRITTLALALGFITESELPVLDDAMIDRVGSAFEAMVGNDCRFKMIPIEGKTLSAPDLSTFSIVE